MSHATRVPERPRFLTEKKAANYFGISVSTMRRLRLSSCGPPFFHAGDIIRYKLPDLDAFIERELSSEAA